MLTHKIMSNLCECSRSNFVLLSQSYQGNLIYFIPSALDASQDGIIPNIVTRMLNSEHEKAGKLMATTTRKCEHGVIVICSQLGQSPVDFDNRVSTSIDPNAAHDPMLCGLKSVVYRVAEDDDKEADDFDDDDDA